MDRDSDFSSSDGDDLHLRMSVSEGEEETSWRDDDIGATSSQRKDDDELRMVEMDKRLRFMEAKINKMETLIVDLHRIVVERSRPLPRPDQLTENVEGDENVVRIGDASHSITVDRKRFERSVQLSSSWNNLLLKLLSLVYSKEELASFSYRGDRNVEPPLAALVEDNRYKAIHRQVLKSYPRFDAPGNLSRVRNAVNSKCRKLRRNERNSLSSS